MESQTPINAEIATAVTSPAIIPEFYPEVPPIELNPDFIPPKSGKRFFPVATVENGRHKVSMKSVREMKFLSVMTKTGNIREACAEIGISVRAGKKWMTRPAIQQYVQNQYVEKALSAGLTIEKVMAKLAAAIDGVQPLDKETLEALKEPTWEQVLALLRDEKLRGFVIVARILKPDSQNIHINASSKTVNIHGGTGDSPYSAMSKAELMRRMREVAVESGEMA